MKKVTEEIIRVRFLHTEESVDVDGNKIPAKYGRPTRIRKVIYRSSINTGTKEKPVYKENTRYYSMQSPAAAENLIIKRNSIDPSTFITEWVKGPTPTPRPLNKYTDEQLLKMGHSLEEIAKIRLLTRRKDIDLIYNKTKGALNNEAIRKILQETKGSLLKAYEKVAEYLPKRQKVTAKEHNRNKNNRIAKKGSSKNGTVTVQYIDGNKEAVTKQFPSKGLLNNAEFKRISEFFDGSETMTFKRKKGQKDIEVLESEKIRVAKKAEKNKLRKERSLTRRKEEYDALSLKNAA